MLTPEIAEKIHSKVGGLVNQPLSITDREGLVLAGNDPQVFDRLKITAAPWAIALEQNGDKIGFVVLAQRLDNHDEIAPLIRSLAELILHQALLIDRLPQQQERLDKFIYDLLQGRFEDTSLPTAEARLFDIDITLPRIALVIYMDDAILRGQDHSGSNREALVTRYKFGLTRGLNSYYTSSRNNIVAYLGHNAFCILKDLNGTDTPLEESLERFKRSLPTIHEILTSELKQSLTIGVGNYHPGLKGLAQSYKEAVSAVELGAQNWDSGRIYHIDDFGVVAPLLAGVDESNIYFGRELVEKLEQQKGVSATLDAFLRNNMALTVTAKELGIHRNTLVYRLDRITEILGLDPRSFDDAVQIKLAMLFTRFVEPEV